MGGGEKNDSGVESRPIEEYLDTTSEFQHSDGYYSGDLRSEIEIKKSAQNTTSSLYANFPLDVVDVLVQEGIQNSPPVLDNLLKLWLNEFFKSLFPVGKKKKFLQLFLKNDPFWTPVRVPVRANLVEIFLKNDIKSTEDICKLSVEELLSHPGLLTTVDEKFTGEVIRTAEQTSHVQDDLACCTDVSTRDGPPLPSLPLTGAADSMMPDPKYREMEHMNCVQGSLRMIEGSAIVMNATKDASKRGTAVAHGAKRKASPVSSIVKLMDICSDHQNGSLVDKVVLPHQEIKKFCDSVAARR